MYDYWIRNNLVFLMETSQVGIQGTGFATTSSLEEWENRAKYFMSKKVRRKYFCQ